jgi:hypothetical protein
MQQLFFPLAVIGRLDAQPNYECFQGINHFALGNSSADGRQKCGRGVREKNEKCIEERGDPSLTALHKTKWLPRLPLLGGENSNAQCM